MTFNGDKIIGKPTLAMIEIYIAEKGLFCDAKECFDYWENKEWLTKKGSEVKTLESAINVFNGIVVHKALVMSEIKIFENSQFGKIRTAGTSEEPLFCLADVCKALNLDSSQVMKRLNDGVVYIHPTIDNLGRERNANFVNEDGLYDVILDSRKPEAKAFRKWITSEVLPSIRKYGAYATTETIESIIANPENGIKLLKH